MGLIRTLIVDDEPLARDAIRVLLEHEPDIEIVGEYGDGRGAAEGVRDLRPDLVFLDIQMPEMDGFGVLDGLAEADLPVVIFVTAYDEFAIRAFEMHALDYLLKPFDDERFRRALQRARIELSRREDSRFTARLAAMLSERRGAPSASGEGAPAPPSAPNDREGGGGGEGEHLRRIVLKKGGRVFFLDATEIDWVEAVDYYVRLHAGGESYLLRTSMKSLEESLDPERFFRIHRSSIVNLDRVRELQPYFHGEFVVILEDGTRLPLSRSRRRQLERRLHQKL